MAEEKQSTSYGNIFKTTFLFGFVQVFKAVIGIVKNKIAAILIGAEGIGIIGIYSSTIQMIQTGAGLGINQSAVRDISEANGSRDYNRFSKIISVTNKVILFTGLLGCFITIGLSYWLSEWTFGDNAHIVAYCILAFVVTLNIINESKQAILKGMRQLKALAYASMIGSVAGLFVSVPLFFFLGKEGIIPELLIAAIIMVLVSNFYVSRIKYTKEDITLKELTTEARPMIKMGIALMTVTFIQTIVSFIVNAFIRNQGGLEDVGYYSAGNTIINSYFSVIVTALMTDYYPRIAAVNKDNDAIQTELNKQSLVSMVMCTPLFVLFIALMPLFIKVLYTNSFLPTVDFVKWSIYFTFLTVSSNQVDMILVAKYETKVFMSICIVFRLIQIVLSLWLYGIMGLEGLGIAYLILGCLHFLIMSVTVYKLYKIRFSSLFLKIFFISAILVISATLIQEVVNNSVCYLYSGVLFMFSLFFSYFTIRRVMEIDILKFIKSKVSKK